MDDLSTAVNESGKGRYGVKVIESQNSLRIEWFVYRSQQNARFNFLNKNKNYKLVKKIEKSRLTGKVVEC